ncbi:MAG TPA: hypothetical protein DCX25_01375 [Candidatus Pacebacteria bacterium]|nr:hypothetical protein [Candidatus Paceibacterota bacterium]HCR93272.1 hypothetical protein [Candidatus Paceibacterota bacterium]
MINVNPFSAHRIQYVRCHRVILVYTYRMCSMPEPYNMVVISAIITFGLVAALFVYRYIFPKKKLKLFFVLILLSLLPLWSILRPGSYESGDLAIHATFAMPFFDSLKEGNVVPIWNSYFLQGNGYPLYAFTYPFPYYAISLFHVAGFSFIDSIKALLIVSFIGSGVGIYAFVKKELQSDISAFTAAVFYLFAPYHLIDMHFRVALGETIAFMILPFCFFMLKNMSKTLSYKNLMGFAFAFGLLILSHQAIALITLPLLLMYAATLYPTNLQKLRYTIFVGAGFILTLALTLFYWLPLLVESKYTNILSAGTIEFPTMREFFYSPWRWGFLYQGHQGELSFILGYIHWIGIALSLLLLIKNKGHIFGILSKFFSSKSMIYREKVLYAMVLGAFITLFFMTQKVSQPIWTSITLLHGFQFSYRLLLLLAFLSSILIGILAKYIKRPTIVLVVCAITIGITILNWGNRKTVLNVTDATIRANLLQSFTKVGPGRTVWVDTDMLKPPKTPMEITQGKAEITQTYRTSTTHRYTVRVDSDTAILKENTLYFPGWTVFVDERSYPMSFTNASSPGFPMFSLLRGKYDVEVKFVDTPVRFFSKRISFGVALIMLELFLFSVFRPHSAKIVSWQKPPRSRR